MPRTLPLGHAIAGKGRLEALLDEIAELFSLVENTQGNGCTRPVARAVGSVSRALLARRGGVAGDAPDRAVADLLTRHNVADTERAGGALGPEVLGAIVERFGGGRGVHYTPAALIDDMCRVAVRDLLASELAPHDAPVADSAVGAGPVEGPENAWATVHAFLGRVKVIDPACGAGAFLIGMHRVLVQASARAALALRLDEPAAQHRRRLATNLTGVDVSEAACAAARARLALATGWGADAVDVRRADALLEPIGGFDIVIGNPPYTGHKRIADPAGARAPGEYLALIRRRTHALHGAFFGLDPCTGLAARSLSGRSDLYAYFIAQSLAMARPGGIVCLLTSSFWLDADYGARLRELLARSSSVRLVCELARRAFDAGINTAVILARRQEPGASVRLVAGAGGAAAAPLCAASARHVPAASLGAGAWGPLVRAPDVFFDACPTVPLARYAAVVTGMKRAGYAAAFVRCDDCTVRAPGLEPIIKDSRRHPAIEIAGADALLRPGIAGPGPRPIAPLLWLAMRGRRHICYHNPRCHWFSGNFLGIVPHRPEHTPALLAVLNSAWAYLAAECIGRAGFGLGSLFLSRSDLLRLPVPDLDNLGRDRLHALSRAGEGLRHAGPIGAAIAELTARRPVDIAVGAALGLEGPGLDRVRRAAARMIAQRLDRARHDPGYWAEPGVSSIGGSGESSDGSSGSHSTLDAPSDVPVATARSICATW